MSDECERDNGRELEKERMKNIWRNGEGDDGGEL